MSQLKSGNSTAPKKVILFILASVFFWFLTKLSKEYDDTIDYPVEYINLPNDKLLQQEPIKSIDIHIKASGFKLISAALFPQQIKIDASNLAAKSSTEYYLLVSQQRLAIQRQMKTGVEIDHFIADSINFNLGSLKSKKIPVKFNSNLSYDTGYEIDGVFTITPDSISISGPESILDTIHAVETLVLTKKEIHESIQEELGIKSFSANSNIRLQESKVTVSASVEKFTEGALEIPFQVKNLPEDIVMNTYPKLIKVTYRVALANFNKINESSFVIECDYQMSLTNNLTYLVPKLVEKSNLVKSATISPSKIDFIIEK